MAASSFAGASFRRGRENHWSFVAGLDLRRHFVMIQREAGLAFPFSSGQMPDRRFRRLTNKLTKQKTKRDVPRLIIVSWFREIRLGVAARMRNLFPDIS